VTGISGNRGGATARTLLERGARVRAVVRDPVKGALWASRGAEVAIADLADSTSLARAFAGVDAAYVLNPPAYASEDLFVQAEVFARSISEAAQRSRLSRLVVLSSIGVHRTSGHGNIATNSTFERILGVLGGSVTFIRPAYFMENWGWVAAAAANDGLLPSFLSPLDRAIEMISTADIGRIAAKAMLDAVTARASSSSPGQGPTRPTTRRRRSPRLSDIR
jgi:uncharacterized protein YbjT (DUF2867 family)